MFLFFRTVFHQQNLLIFGLFALALSGCSTIPDKSSSIIIEQTPEQRITKLEQLQQWKVKGKIAFIEKESRNSATLSWKVNENQNSQLLNLTSYLGINVLQLESSDNNHNIQVDGKTYHGRDLETLIYSITGLTLPTKALTFWLKGMPYKDDDTINYHESTQLPLTLSSYYNNELWQVSYAKYQQINGYSLATKFSIRKDDLLIKIVINDWAIAKK